MIKTTVCPILLVSVPYTLLVVHHYVINEPMSNTRAEIRRTVQSNDIKSSVGPVAVGLNIGISCQEPLFNKKNPTALRILKNPLLNSVFELINLFRWSSLSNIVKLVMSCTFKCIPQVTTYISRGSLTLFFEQLLLFFVCRHFIHPIHIFEKGNRFISGVR